MENRLSRWGVGPKTLALTLAYAVVARAVTRAWPDECLLRSVPHALFVIPATILLALGLPMLLVAVTSATKAYNRDELVTSGIFAVVRHPIYSAWIVLIIPGLVLLSRSWPVLLTPLVAYTVFKLSIHREDEYLQHRFGQAYLDYRRRVGELFPFASILKCFMNKKYCS